MKTNIFKINCQCTHLMNCYVRNINVYGLPQVLSYENIDLKTKSRYYNNIKNTFIVNCKINNKDYIFYNYDTS